MEIAQFRIDALGAVEGYKKLPRELWHFDASPFELKDFLNFKNPRLKAIAQLLYLEDRDLRQIAKVMGVSEQRIGQLVREIEMEIRKRHNEEP